jgi:uncharacterized protein YutE (UPF0331/DUF86 family)
MAKVHEQVEAEYENIERALAEVPDMGSLLNLSNLELAGLAALIHNFYNGVENILKLLVNAVGKKLPDGPSWHQDLINTAIANDIISESTARKLRQYLAFRHFFSHGYSFELDPKRMSNLVKDIRPTFDCFKKEINKAIERI